MPCLGRKNGQQARPLHACRQPVPPWRRLRLCGARRTGITAFDQMLARPFAAYFAGRAPTRSLFGSRWIGRDLKGYCRKTRKRLCCFQPLGRKDFCLWKDPRRRKSMSMNCWRFDDRIFSACRDVPQSPRGEFELPEAVGLAVRRGVPFKTFAARGPVLDLSTRADAADVARRLAGISPRP